MMKIERHLDWADCHNVRDLGGLGDASGAVICSGKFIRADSPNKLNSTGWQKLRDYGVRTLIDLRSANETERLIHNLDSITVVNLPHDGAENKEFWGEWNSPSWDKGARLASSPLYYIRHIDCMPERSVRVLQAIADAQEGAVLFHCIAGRDRTGLISLLLHVLDINPDEIADDYCLSLENRLRRGSAQDQAMENIVAALFTSTRSNTSADNFAHHNRGQFERETSRGWIDRRTYTKAQSSRVRDEREMLKRQRYAGIHSE